MQGVTRFLQVGIHNGLCALCALCGEICEESRHEQSYC
jgi:hypothetical protein